MKTTEERQSWQDITNSRDVDKANFMHCWKGMSNPDNNPFQMEWFGLAMGLGFVLAFGYWATNFAVVQCGMATNSMLAARRTPLIAAVPKMFFPFLIVVPGIIAVVVAAQKPNDQGLIPVKKEMWTKEPSAYAIRGETLVSLQRNKVPDNVVAKLREWMQKEEKGKQFANQEALLTALKGTLTDEEIKEHGQLIVKNSKPERDYDLAMPMMLLQYLPTGILGLGLTALLASFMSGVAGNTAAINNVWTFDIYRAYLNPNKSERHYLLMGHAATFVGTALAIGAGFIALKFNNIMEMLQFVFAFVNAPLFATFLLGMFWKRTTGHGAFYGLLSGTVAAAIHHGLTLPAGAAVGVKGGWLTFGGGVLHTYGSEFADSFWLAIVAWTVCFVVTIVVSLATKPHDDRDLVGLVYSLTERPKEEHIAWYSRPVAWAVAVVVLCVILNIIFW